jgi:hypothetical protein
MKSNLTPKQKQINYITSTVKEFINDQNPNDLEIFLGHIREIICQFDTDVAISVLNEFGDEGKEQAMVVKVSYGY